jgi:hypothetical protein
MTLNMPCHPFSPLSLRSGLYPIYLFPKDLAQRRCPININKAVQQGSRLQKEAATPCLLPGDPNKED